MEGGSVSLWMVIRGMGREKDETYVHVAAAVAFEVTLLHTVVGAAV